MGGVAIMQRPPIGKAHHHCRPAALDSHGPRQAQRFWSGRSWSPLRTRGRAVFASECEEQRRRREVEALAPVA